MAYTFYFDARALAKRYAPEQGSDLIDHIFEHVPRNRLTSLTLAAAEVASILVRKRNGGRISTAAFARGMAELHTEVLNAAEFETFTATDSLVLAAIPFIEQHSINSVDAVMLLSALDFAAVLRTMGDDVVIVASDLRLLRAAQAEGLTVFNPETDPQSQLDALIAVA